MVSIKDVDELKKLVDHMKVETLKDTKRRKE